LDHLWCAAVVVNIAFCDALVDEQNDNVLVASGTLPDISHEERDRFLSVCPELKILYPSLHDPSCFGASPNSTVCAKTICALQVFCIGVEVTGLVNREFYGPRFQEEKEAVDDNVMVSLSDQHLNRSE
jgi:hypothetical protein